jgi:hypothetical protein
LAQAAYADTIVQAVYFGAKVFFAAGAGVVGLAFTNTIVARSAVEAANVFAGVFLTGRVGNCGKGSKGDEQREQQGLGEFHTMSLR